MTAKYSLAFNFISESHLSAVISSFGSYDCQHFFVAARSSALSVSNASIVSGYGIEFRQSLEQILSECATEWILFLLKPVNIELKDDFKLWLEVLNTQVPLFSYSAHLLNKDGSLQQQPLIEYQAGSVKDDFDFGSLLFVNVAKAREIFKRHPALIVDDQTAFYGLRLAASLEQLPLHYTQFSYQIAELDKQDQHIQHFAYASAAGAAQQKAFERTFIEFSKIAGFYPEQTQQSVTFSTQEFTTEASVIIPVKNRAGKIEHAVESALKQKTTFSFNVIVVDNHSDDGTTESLKGLAAKHSNLVHLIPERKDLGIGGCWQLAIEHPACGKFCAQLDSDDLYIDENVLTKIVQKFYQQNCAAIVGSYLLVDKDLNPIPPGAIEHREWNDLTGYTNILRINGLGAPRAYYTPVIRKIGFPNVSYGEDYSAMLGVSRSYKIGRIYDHLYLCRRWEGNSDAQPGIEKMNRFNYYKDSLRTKEIEARKSSSTCFNCE